MPCRLRGRRLRNRDQRMRPPPALCQRRMRRPDRRLQVRLPDRLWRQELLRSTTGLPQCELPAWRHLCALPGGRNCASLHMPVSLRLPRWFMSARDHHVIQRLGLHARSDQPRRRLRPVLPIPHNTTQRIAGCRAGSDLLQTGATGRPAESALESAEQVGGGLPRIQPQRRRVAIGARPLQLHAPSTGRQQRRGHVSHQSGRVH